jgi:hypothetical protein
MNAGPYAVGRKSMAHPTLTIILYLNFDRFQTHSQDQFGNEKKIKKQLTAFQVQQKLTQSIFALVILSAPLRAISV